MSLLTFSSILFVYFSDRIEQFIDENKALMRRMYGDFEMITQYGPPLPNNKRKRDVNSFNNQTMPPGVPDLIGPPETEDYVHNGGSASYFTEYRAKRQTNQNFARNGSQRNTNGPTKPTIGLNPSMEPNSGRFV